MLKNDEFTFCSIFVWMKMPNFATAFRKRDVYTGKSLTVCSLGIPPGRERSKGTWL